MSEEFEHWYDSLHERVKRSLDFDMTKMVWQGCEKQMHTKIYEKDKEISSLKLEIDIYKERFEL